MTREARFLKQARINSGLTQGELAKELGYGCAQFVSNQERAISGLPRKHIKDFIYITNCSRAGLYKALVKDHEQELKKWF